jgi:MoaA/NifB/PqqE/SkfB family radical SAM enzyme
MKYLKRFNEASFDRIEEFIKLADKIINYDEIELEEGDEPSNTDILSELGDLCNELTFTSEEIQQVIDSGRISDPNNFLKIILDETLRDEEAMENDETPTLNIEDIESKIKEAAYSLRGFGTMTKNAAFINGAKWVIHNLTDAEINHLRKNSDSDDHSFFGL